MFRPTDRPNGAAIQLDITGLEIPAHIGKLFLAELVRPRRTYNHSGHHDENNELGIILVDASTFWGLRKMSAYIGSFELFC